MLYIFIYFIYFDFLISTNFCNKSTDDNIEKLKKHIDEQKEKINDLLNRRVHIEAKLKEKQNLLEYYIQEFDDNSDDFSILLSENERNILEIKDDIDIYNSRLQSNIMNELLIAQDILESESQLNSLCCDFN